MTYPHSTHVDAIVLHTAFNTPPLTLIEEPTVNPDPLPGYNTMVASSCHIHVATAIDSDSSTSERILPQAKLLDIDPFLLVSESKATRICVPSFEN